METLINVLTYLIFSVLMTVFYGIVAVVLGAVWGFDVSLILALKIGITGYVLSIVAPMIFCSPSSDE